MDLLQFPKEIIQMITGFLDPKSLVKFYTLVSKKLPSQLMAISRLEFRHEKLETLKHLPRLAIFNELNELVIRANERYMMTLSALQKCPPTIQILTLDFARFPYAFFSPAYTSTKSLPCHSLGSPWGVANLSSIFPRLKGLHILGSDWSVSKGSIPLDMLKIFFSNLPYCLESLTLIGLKLRQLKSIHYMPCQLKNFECLNLDGVCSVDIPILKSCSTLESLNWQCQERDLLLIEKDESIDGQLKNPLPTTIMELSISMSITVEQIVRNPNFLPPFLVDLRLCGMDTISYSLASILPRSVFRLTLKLKSSESYTVTNEDSQFKFAESLPPNLQTLRIDFYCCQQTLIKLPKSLLLVAARGEPQDGQLELLRTAHGFARLQTLQLHL